jgi:hypothetical protein
MNNFIMIEKCMNSNNATVINLECLKSIELIT